TSPIYLVAGLNRALKEVFLTHEPVALAERLFLLQDHFLDRLEHPDIKPLKWPMAHRSGILSLYHPNADVLSEYLHGKGIIIAPRGGYIRVAAHYYNTESEMEYLATVLNEFRK